ncbi:uncharacterized protein LOC109712496 [Ananas comosus]|uniref:Uncharacterized protein LOC109712496 n=2 Tax=Ananas comosus TaxID=4615 RepID=A0A6P5FED2_ANACO|nr:uncharacterized protein LOC109712496 [Ananas comosus]
MFRVTTSPTMPLATVSSSAVSSPPPLPQPNRFRARRPSLVVVCCKLGSVNAAESGGKDELTIGSPIIVVVAPPTLKTASSMPSLRVNSGLVKPGDVGRIVARKPKDVWAVRLAIGTYLIDGKHFKPLDVDE